jgi:uncharacterized protein (TIGR02145 family)
VCAQVTIGAGTPPHDFSVLELISNQNMGLRMPLLTTGERDNMTMTAEFQTYKEDLAKGLTIFNTTTDCLEFWNGAKWISKCDGEASPCGLARPAITGNTVLCSGTATLKIIPSTPGSYTYTWYKDDTPIGNDQTITVTAGGDYYATVTDGCTSPMAHVNIPVVSSAIPGVTLTSSSATPGTASESEEVTYGASITYGPALNYIWTITNATLILGGQQGETYAVVKYDTSGNASVKVEASNACGTASSTHTVTVTGIPSEAGTGYFTGKICFDIAYSDFGGDCGEQATRLPQKTDFSLTGEQDPQVGTSTPTYTGRQVYTFTPLGNVSNVRFDYIDTSGEAIESMTAKADYTGNISPGSPCKAVVVYKETLNTFLQGKTRENAVKTELYVIYNDAPGGAGTDRAIKITVSLQDCSCCGAYVAAGVWKEFMCHNLGADESLNPFTPTIGLNGNYYQWGRKDPVAVTYYPADPIELWNTAYYSTGAWAHDIRAANDPCPPGYRVPTNAEWTGVADSSLNTQEIIGTWVASNTYIDGGIKFGKALFLPFSGSLLFDTGYLDRRNRSSRYWSSSIGGSGMSMEMWIGQGGPYLESYYRSSGNPVRCIAE